MNTIITDSSKRHDFVLLFDVADGNPNGDPDAGNLPRLDPETMQGLVTDVCIKRKVRNFVDATHGTEARNKIYVQNLEALNVMHKRAYTALNIKSTGTKQKRNEVNATRDWMCANFFDIRTFGAVMTTEVNCGQVRGPLQLTFARSRDAIIPQDISITRIAVTKESDATHVEGEGDQARMEGKVSEMGRKSLVPYGLYLAHGFFNPHFAKQTGMDSKDLEIFWEALQKMWDLDRSASRGMMACRGIYIFSHKSPYGDAPAHKLFEKIQVRRRDGSNVPRSFGDYTVTVTDDLPAGITLTRLVD